MLSFFRRKHNDDELKRTGEDSAIAADEVGDVDEQPSASSETISPALSLHPDWHISKEQRYVYQFLNNDCPPLQKNQVGISGIEWEEENGKIRVSAFLRNSSNETLELNEHTLVMFNKNDEPLAKKTFDLSELGKIEPESSRPWHFYFDEDDLIDDYIPKEGWRLAFEIRHIAEKHTLDLPLEWEDGLHPQDKENLYKLVEQLPELEEGEVNLFGVDAKQDPEGRIHVVALLRNGSEHDIRLDHVPLMFKDATDTVIAQDNFKLKDFIVKPNTSKPWRFAFTKPVNYKVDLTTWEIQLLTQ